MTEQARYRRREVVSRKLQNKLLVFSPESQQTIVLNASAALIWATLSTSRTLDQIVEFVSTAFEGSRQDVVRAEIQQALTDLQSEGLLETAYSG